MPTLQTGEPLDAAGLAGDAKKDLQGQLLSDLVVRLAGSGNAFWEERLADIDPESVTSLDDLGRLPFTVKQDLREQYPLGMVISPMEATTRLHASSGTSGKPTIVVYTPHDLAVWAEVNARALVLAGARPGDIRASGVHRGTRVGGEHHPATPVTGGPRQPHHVGYPVFFAGPSRAG